MHVIVSFFRPAVSPPTWGNRPKSPASHAKSQNHQKSLLGATGVDASNADAGARIVTKPANFQVPKRTRSPVLSSAEVHLGNSPSAQDDSERFCFFFPAGCGCGEFGLFHWAFFCLCVFCPFLTRLILSSYT